MTIRLPFPVGVDDPVIRHSMNVESNSVLITTLSVEEKHLLSSTVVLSAVNSS